MPSTYQYVGRFGILQPWLTEDATVPPCTDFQPSKLESRERRSRFSRAGRYRKGLDKTFWLSRPIQCAANNRSDRPMSAQAVAPHHFRKTFSVAQNRTEIIYLWLASCLTLFGVLHPGWARGTNTMPHPVTNYTCPKRFRDGCSTCVSPGRSPEKKNLSN